MTAPALATHLPRFLNEHATHGRRLIWIDRVTGEEIPTVCNSLDIPLRDWPAAMGMTQDEFDTMIVGVMFDPRLNEISDLHMKWSKENS